MSVWFFFLVVFLWCLASTQELRGLTSSEASRTQRPHELREAVTASQARLGFFFLCCVFEVLTNSDTVTENPALLATAVGVGREGGGRGGGGGFPLEGGGGGLGGGGGVTFGAGV